jgi:beta-galactosidase GanA
MNPALLVPVLTPHGHLSLAREADAVALDEEVGRRLEESFARGAGHGLLQLGASEVGTALPAVFSYWREFSANIAEFLAFQANLLWRHTKGLFITHNGSEPFGNCFEFAKALDFLSVDLYPLVGQFTNPAFSADLWRGSNHGRSFLVLEQRSGMFGDYTLKDATPPPGLARLWAWQTLAHGADGVLFFRWRRNNGGSEQYWQGLMNDDGSPSRAFEEVSQMAYSGRCGQAIPLDVGT